MKSQLWFKGFLLFLSKVVWCCAWRAPSRGGRSQTTNTIVYSTHGLTFGLMASRRGPAAAGVWFAQVRVMAFE
jgi:hypothetical protein